MNGLLLAADYPGMDGFLGTRGSVMLDFVFLAMFAIVPIMGWSIWLVKYRQKYDLHKKIQITLGLVLLVTVGAFEVDMQIITTREGWLARAAPSPYFQYVWPSLYVHLFFAVPTLFLWIYVIVSGIRNFPKPAAPCDYSPTHRRWAKLAAIEMTMTAVTGWIFYWLAFVAT
jgi:putative membrane protein